MRPSLTLPLVAGLALASATAFAADATSASTTTPEKTMTAPATPPTAPASFESMDVNGQKYVLVCGIKTVEANRQFQQNVQVVQNQLTQVKELQKRVEQALTLVEKEALKKVLDDTNKSLEQNNALMAKTYGFSILRQYIAEIGKTRLYTPITDAEYDKAKADKGFSADHYIVNEKDKFAHIATISGVAENNIFRQNVQLVQTQRQRLVQLQAAVDQTKDAAEKAKLQDEFKKSEEVLLKNNADMTKQYGFSLTRNYVMEIEESKLFMAVTPEEFAKQKAEADKAGTAPKAAEAVPAPAAK